MIELANRLDALVLQDDLFVVETPETVALSGASAEIAQEIAAHLLRLGWQCQVEDNANEIVMGALDAAFEPYRLHAAKPVTPGRIRFLTIAGFKDWLSREPAGLTQVVANLSPFSTGAFRLGDWADMGEHQIAPPTKSPRSLVRETSEQRVTPVDIRPWILTVGETPDWDDPTFRVWRRQASRECLRALASEVDSGLEFRFMGSACLRVTDTAPDEGDISPASFTALQLLTRWVYESESDAETRFRLVNHEFARLGRTGRSTFKEVLDYAEIALEGARLAFQYNLAQVSADSAKALSDLRKSLSDETGRLAEMVRQLIGAVAGAIFAGIGLIAARITTETPAPALLTMGVVLGGYITFIILNGYRQIALQRELRLEWQKRLYSYISNEDYRRMVLNPAGKAEGHFTAAAWGGGVITALVLVALCLAVWTN
ncbi:hypothetical protein [Brevundimonas sp. DC300-4]|uniref:hypothetical protein n=1 Tax=Brevundimonas sp. DC300-4 TaxID=2804594 RepID=UPI003CF17555